MRPSIFPIRSVKKRSPPFARHDRLAEPAFGRSNKRDIGKVFEVLIEGFSKRSREQLFGRTSQNKVVIFDKKNYRVGQFVKVRINRASSATLFGDPVE